MAVRLSQNINAGRAETLPEKFSRPGGNFYLPDMLPKGIS
jgi:hypothetical protein